jgi:hypothetical protein
MVVCRMLCQPWYIPNTTTYSHIKFVALEGLFYSFMYVIHTFMLLYTYLDEISCHIGNPEGNMRVTCDLIFRGKRFSLKILKREATGTSEI